MLYIGEPDIPGSDNHEGFVAGRYRNGAYSDIWTNVRRCAERTFLAYAPACECGWRGQITRRPPTGTTKPSATGSRTTFVTSPTRTDHGARGTS